MTNKTETVIEDTFAKQIKVIEDVERTYVEKQFYQHDNIEIYRLIKNNPHENICTIYDIKEDSGFFIVEEAYLGNKTLNELLPITNMHLFYAYILQLCDAVEHLHNLKIVHRDLKPENIFVQGNKVILNDFDISKEIIANEKRKDTHILGSVGFASPEQYGFKKSDARSDIYSLGIIINLMITGGFISETYISGPLKYIVDRCVQINPDDRYQTIDELRIEIQKRERGVSRYSLPGFRSNVRRNKIIASFVYAILIGVVYNIKSSGGVTFYDHLQSQIISAQIFCITIIVVTNYLNVNQFIPRPLKRFKIIGSLYLWLVGIFLSILSYMIFFGIIDSMLAAYQ